MQLLYRRRFQDGETREDKSAAVSLTFVVMARRG
jgi:hypothetical protein